MSARGWSEASRPSIWCPPKERLVLGPIWYPPSSLTYGIAVNARGERFMNEDCYHGRLAGAAFNPIQNGFMSWSYDGSVKIFRDVVSGHRAGDVGAVAVVVVVFGVGGVVARVKEVVGDDLAQ